MEPGFLGFSCVHYPSLHFVTVLIFCVGFCVVGLVLCPGVVYWVRAHTGLWAARQDKNKIKNNKNNNQQTWVEF
jgi:hypothetical protein